jgi:D-sedoheptulose 7-phosphate isomerase
MRCVALVGEDVGEVGALADVAVHVPSRDTQRIQEVHALVVHTLCALLERRVVASPTPTDGARA